MHGEIVGPERPVILFTICRVSVGIGSLVG
jgi:hypothetical protein